MRRFSFVFITVFIFIVIQAQDNQQLTDGYHIYKYPNGAVSSEGMIKNGRPEGFWKNFYVTGVKISEGKRTNFLLDSIWVFFDQVGDTTEKISYLLGKKNGWNYKYKKDPAKGVFVYSKELYAGDKKEGSAYIFYPDGKIQQTIPYNNGKKEGLSKEYDKEGNIVTLLEYNNDFLVSRDKINSLDNKGLKQGTWKEFYPNGSLKSEKTFKDDQMHGYYKEYDNRGRLTLTMLYDNGRIVKSNVEDEPDIEIVDKHDENGKLTYRGTFRNKIPVGTHREYGSDGKVKNSFIYNDNGVLISEGIVDDAGNRNGKWKDFYPDGKILDEGQLTDNRRTGFWKFYTLTGKVEQTGSYNNGRPDGSWKWFYGNDTILKEEEYFQGVRDGLSTEYSPTGEIIAQGQFSDGERNGEWKFKSPEFSEEGKYLLGLKDGVWKSYYGNGKQMFKGKFIQGNPDGPQIYYYDSGKVKEEQYFQMGIREKTWKKFNEDGTLFLVISYKNDLETSINGVKIKLPESDAKLIK
jgi:uncharacterized protein